MKQVQSSASSPARQRGVALLEGLIAILLIAIALIGLMSLQANMLKSTGEARERNEAARVVQQAVASLWSTDTPSGLSGTQDIPTLPNGKLTISNGAPAGCPLGSCTYTIVAKWGEASQPLHDVTFVAIR